jgi:apolipoprotein N-acyltransferase
MRPLHKNGAELFINMSDDSWSLKKSSEYQHFCVAAYRAIEYRTTMLRSCNAGYSVVLDPAGKILCDLPLFEQVATNYDVPVYKYTVTTYARFGNWLCYSMVIAVIVYCIYCYLSFIPDDYIPSERKKKSGKKSKKHKK